MQQDQQTQSAVSDTAQRVAQGATEQARKAQQELGREAQRIAGDGKDGLAARAEHLAQAGERAAEDLEARGDQDLADGLRYAAEKLAGFADDLQRRSVGDLMRDAESLARRHPALFVGGSIALGLVLSRAFKAGAGAGADGHS